MTSRASATDNDGSRRRTTELSWKEALFQTMEDVAFVFTPEGNVLDWNDRVPEVSGYSDEEIRNMHPAEFVPEDQRDLIYKMIAAVLTGGRVTFEAEIRTKAGVCIPYEFRGFLLERDQQQFIYGTGRDITQRKRKTRTVQHATRRYRRLFEQAREGIIVNTLEGTIIDVNPALCRLTDYPLEKLLGMPVRNLFADAEERKYLVQILRDRRQHHDFRAKLLRKDGSTMIGHLSTTPWISPDGEIEAFQTFVRDVTEEEQARQALKESEEKFRTLAEQSPLGIGIIQEGHFQYLNRAHAKMLGYTRSELTAESPEQFVHPDDLPKVRTHIKRRIKGETDTVNYSFRGLTKEGDIRMIEVHGGRITYRGKPAVLGTLVDVTERRRLQREILSIQEKERQRIGQDLHDAIGSHLSGTRMALQVLASRAEERYPELAEELDRITSLVQESSRDVQRLSRGLNLVGLQETRITFALERLVTNIKEEKIHCRFDEECEQLELSDEVASHLYWIAQEAVTNARKYAEADAIDVELTCRERHLILTVDDDGKGFEPAGLEENGLGLRTMRYRAKLLGGTLTLESNPGDGTTVETQIPLA